MLGLISGVVSVAAAIAWLMLALRTVGKYREDTSIDGSVRTTQFIELSASERARNQKLVRRAAVIWFAMFFLVAVGQSGVRYVDCR
jgi:hypothetical protein